MAMSTGWTAAEQFKKHTPKAPKVIPGVRELGLNRWGGLEGFLLYGRKGQDVEYAIDIDIQQIPTPDGKKTLVVGAIILCPRCGQSCYIPGPGSMRADARQFHIHYDKMEQSPVDAKWRPKFTIEGAFACDYFMSEVNGIVAPRMVDPCGFRGVIEMGRMYDAPKLSVVR